MFVLQKLNFLFGSNFENNIKCYIYPSIFTAAIVLSEKMGFHQKKIEFKKISTETENSSTEQKKVDASTFEKIVKEQKRKLEHIFENWTKGKKTGGQMRHLRGGDVESFVSDTVNLIGVMEKIDLQAKKGTSDMKMLKVNGIQKKHQVDIHIYLNSEFIAVIECKNYLDKCFYERACDDFLAFKRSRYSLKNYVFSIEDSIKHETITFTNSLKENICDDIFYIVDGKRSSTKPLYQFRKKVNTKKLERFIRSIYDLVNLSRAMS